MKALFFILSLTVGFSANGQTAAEQASNSVRGLLDTVYSIGKQPQDEASRRSAYCNMADQYLNLNEIASSVGDKYYKNAPEADKAEFASALRGVFVDLLSMYFSKINFSKAYSISSATSSGRRNVQVNTTLPTADSSTTVNIIVSSASGTWQVVNVVVGIENLQGQKYREYVGKLSTYATTYGNQALGMLTKDLKKQTTSCPGR